MKKSMFFLVCFICFVLSSSAFAQGTWTTYTTEDGLAGNKVLSITIDADGTKWFATYEGGVSHFDGANWTTYTTEDGLAINSYNYVNSIAIDTDGTIWVGTNDGLSVYDESGVSVEFKDLAPSGINLANSPNPFNPSTTIEYRLPQDSHMILTIYNMSGQAVSVLKDGYSKAGNYSVIWNAAGMPSGLYFCTLRANGFTETRKMLLVK